MNVKQTSKFLFGLDYRMAKHTGIGTYLRGITGGFQNSGLIGSTELSLFGSGAADHHSFSKIYFDASIYSVAEQYLYREFLPLCRVWHAPHYNVPFFKGKTKLVVTIHDVIHWVYRNTLNPLQRVYAEVMLRRAVSLSDHLITVSEHSKSDLVRFFNADPDKISVVCNGVAPEFTPTDSPETVRALLGEKYGIKSPFFLYVGMLKPHKNVLRLARSFLDLQSRNELRSGLVVIGQGAEESPEVALLRGSAGRIHYLPKIEFGDLQLFYQASTALVHPSLYEGFGLTVLEAMSCGAPVLTTKRASLPEVAGPAALYMDGEDEGEMKTALKRLDGDFDLRKKLSEAGLVQACRFSWDKAARETAEIYKKVLAQ